MLTLFTYLWLINIAIKNCLVKFGRFVDIEDKQVDVLSHRVEVAVVHEEGDVVVAGGLGVEDVLASSCRGQAEVARWKEWGSLVSGNTYYSYTQSNVSVDLTLRGYMFAQLQRRYFIKNNMNGMNYGDRYCNWFEADQLSRCVKLWSVQPCS